ncbi:MAG: hypothetical protein ACLQOZ_06705 [Acidimicrobiales bacterium]
MTPEARGGAASVGPPRPDQREEPAAALVQRCGWTLVWLAVLAAGIGFWGSWTSWPGAAAFAPLLVFAGTAGTAAVWLIRNPGSRAMQLAGLGAALVTAGVPQAVAIHARRFYSTDSAAFNDVAARLLVHGRDPYTASMAPAAGLLKSPAQYWTYTVDGGHVSHVSYPAGSFLLDAPAVALGFHHAVVDWVDLGAWLVTGVLLFAIVPAALRWFSLLVVVTSLFVQMFSNGGTDALFLPFLVVAVWRWDRFATARGAGLAGWVGPVALGLACSIKQTPWFCVPFLVVGVALEARRSGRRPWTVAARYLGIVAGVFVAIDLPFIVWSPGAWWSGTLLPLTQPLVADGQGLVTLALHGLTGGVVLPLLSVAGVLVYLALMVAYVAWFPRMKRVWLFVLPAVLFIPARSLSSYLVDFFPVAVVAALTVTHPAATEGNAGAPVVRRWWGALGVAVPVAVAVAVAVVAFTSAPLELSVTGFRTSNATQKLDSVTVSVHNRTDHPVVPHFMVVISGIHPTGFWTTGSERGGVVLKPGATEAVTLYPNLYTWSPANGSYWLVEAYTSSPDALSTTRPQFWTLGPLQ